MSTLNQLKKDLKMMSLVATMCKIQLQKKDNMVRNVWEKVSLEGEGGDAQKKILTFFHCFRLATLQCHT